MAWLTKPSMGQNNPWALGGPSCYEWHNNKRLIFRPIKPTGQIGKHRWHYENRKYHYNDGKKTYIFDYVTYEPTKNNRLTTEYYAFRRLNNFVVQQSRSYCLRTNIVTSTRKTEPTDALLVLDELDNTLTHCVYSGSRRHYTAPTAFFDVMLSDKENITTHHLSGT